MGLTPGVATVDIEVDPLKPAVIGGAGAWRTMKGKAKPPSTPQTDTSIVPMSHVDLGAAMRLSHALTLPIKKYLDVLHELATDTDAAKLRGPYALGALSAAEVARNKASQTPVSDSSFLVKVLTASPSLDLFAELEDKVSKATKEIMETAKLPSFAAIYTFAASAMQKQTAAAIAASLDKEKPTGGSTLVWSHQPESGPRDGPPRPSKLLVIYHSEHHTLRLRAIALQFGTPLLLSACVPFWAKSIIMPSVEACVTLPPVLATAMCKDDLLAGEDVGSFLLVLGNKVGALLSRPPSSDASAEPTIDSAFSHLSLNPYKRLGQMGHFPRTKQMSAGSLTPSASLATGSLLWMLPITPGLQTNAQRSTWFYKAQADLAVSETQGSVLMPAGEDTITLKVNPLRVRLHSRGRERDWPDDPGVARQHRLAPMVHTRFLALLRPDQYASARGVVRAVLRRELQIRDAVPKADGSEHAREVPRLLEVTALVDAAHKAG
eukprot:CAMPEP_0179846446 /NCGR_PEP_ID=MMETSP0982-20121206/5557_1 /TAXON_ID=483367 /ORGANISM="non described non described, Strain CCMP 2436" /LENGTH=491 /DNA_ID=CAMNT_0021731571 /DNA_START=273 /DNA_END=1749 /DNA_ORIENTATION=-